MPIKISEERAKYQKQYYKEYYKKNYKIPKCKICNLEIGRNKQLCEKCSKDKVAKQIEKQKINITLQHWVGPGSGIIYDNCCLCSGSSTGNSGQTGTDHTGQTGTDHTGQTGAVNTGQTGFRQFAT